MGQVSKKWYQVADDYDEGLVSLAGAENAAGPGDTIEIDMTRGDLRDILDGPQSPLSNYALRDEAMATLKDEDAIVATAGLSSDLGNDLYELSVRVKAASLEEGLVISLPRFGVSGTITRVNYFVQGDLTGTGTATIAFAAGEEDPVELDIVDEDATGTEEVELDVDATDTLTIEVTDEAAFTDGTIVIQATVETS